MSVDRKLGEETELQTFPSKREINIGAEKWLGKPIQILDHGTLQLLDYMGTDNSIEEAARISYREGTRKVDETKGLINYLRRNRHTTPFEMAELKFYVKMPIFVARQWIRHRMASVNEESGRYSILSEEHHIPGLEDLGVQSSKNRQGRGDFIGEITANEFQSELERVSQEAYERYRYFLNDDGKGKPLDPNKPMVARETAREFLTMNIYTRWIWKCDLHNIFHFLGLRAESHAQKEIRQYAIAMAEIVKDSFPIAYNAFEDYEFNAISLSTPEQKIISEILKDKGIVVTAEEIDIVADKLGFTNKRERGEIKDKFKKMGIAK